MASEQSLWWIQSQADLKTAQDDFRSGNYYATTLFCQQAAEKALKAVIANQGKIPQKTHSLPELAAIAGIKELRAPLAALNPWQTLSRYPDISGKAPVQLIKKPDAEGAIKNAKEVLEWIQKLLNC